VIRPVRFAGSCLLLLTLVCCGGNSPPPSNNPPPANPSPPPSPSPTPTNPCASVSFDEEVVTGAEPSRAKVSDLLGNDDRDVLEALWIHRSARDTQVAARNLTAATEDIGDIAVIQDAGDIILPANRFDLQGVGLRFRRSGDNYEVTRTDAAFRSTLGNRITLQDDDTSGIDLPFAFPFYGREQRRVFVNSDGNLTFEQSDTASTDRSVSRVLVGPPRVAPFFDDLDPSTGSGRVFAQSGSDAFTVTWCNVRGFDEDETVTVQASLLPTGDVEIKFGEQISLPSAVVGIAPGRSSLFNVVDLGTATGSSGALQAIGERFAAEADIDLIALARRFYQGHPDLYDQLVIWTDRSVTGDGTFAYESTVSNEVRGIGANVFNSSAEFGSAGRLKSTVVMDVLTKYPDNPATKFLGENSTLSLVGHETGHQWLALLRFRDAAGANSTALLGRQQAHWSFFFDSDASVVEGNDIEDLGGGQFRTTAAVQRYSLLDQYAMGLVGDNQVGELFYVEAPVNVQPSRDAESAPQVGVTFSGTRRTILMQDIISANGARQPSVASSSKLHRQAFIYVLSVGRTLDRSQTDKIDRIRREWEPWFGQATNGRATVETRLRPPT
jgi:hypothetical protein